MKTRSVNMQKINDALSDMEQYIETHPQQNEVIAQLVRHRQTIKHLQHAIEKKDFKAAFIGKIGVGKTSAICQLLGLQYTDVESGEVTDILKTGSGRTTVCEVSIEYAERYSVAIKPMPENEIKLTVSDFSEFIWNKIKRDVREDEEGGSLLSEEMSRCIRNMLGLPIKKERLDGKPKSTDMAVELAKDCNNIDELKDLMFSCLGIEQRTELEIWPTPDENRDWKKWLKKNFAEINDGKNKKMSLPEKLIIRGPFLLGVNDINWTIVDTRGVDGNVSRADLRKVIQEDGTFPIITSSFNDARAVLEMGCNSGQLEKLKRESVLLVLDRDEAHKVTDVDSSLPKNERVIEGRSIRAEQVSNRLQYDLKWDGVIEFFDCKQERAEKLWGLLSSRHEAYLSYYQQELSSVCSAINELLSAEEQRYIEFRKALQNLYLEWRQNADEATPSWEHFGKKLCHRLEKIHHRTLAASIRRNGIYSNLDFYEVVRALATKSANKFVIDEVYQLQSALTQMAEEHGFDEFQDQISSELRKIEREMQIFAEQVGDLATNVWVSCLGSKNDVWQDWDSEWGLGSGYKKRVLRKINEWVQSTESVEMHHHFLRTIAARWGRVLEQT